MEGSRYILVFHDDVFQVDVPDLLSLQEVSGIQLICNHFVADAAAAMMARVAAAGTRIHPGVADQELELRLGLQAVAAHAHQAARIVLRGRGSLTEKIPHSGHVIVQVDVPAERIELDAVDFQQHHVAAVVEAVCGVAQVRGNHAIGIIVVDVLVQAFVQLLMCTTPRFLYERGSLAAAALFVDPKGRRASWVDERLPKLVVVLGSDLMGHARSQTRLNRLCFFHNHRHALSLS